MSKSSTCVLSGAIMQGALLIGIALCSDSNVGGVAIVGILVWITSMVLIVGGCRGKDDWDS